MKSKKMQARSNTKTKVTPTSSSTKIRRCEMKLRRFKFDGVGLNQNSKNLSKSLLQEQQNLNNNNTLNGNYPKRTRANTLSENNCSNIKNPLQKIRKCVVRLKRIHLSAEKNMSKPITRNPLLALTRRRALELGCKKQTQNSEKQVLLNQITSENESSKADLTNLSNKSTASTKATSARNLLNKTDVIAEILTSDDGDFSRQPTSNQSEVQEIIGNQTKATHKFFHKENKSLLINEKPKNAKNTKIPNKKQTKNTNKNIKNKRAGPPKKSGSKNDIYEFLSQSQTSDSNDTKDKDVASDIIKKLIDEGNVVVTKHHKGRPRRVRRQPARTLKKLKTVNKQENNKNNVNFPNDNDDDDHFGNREELPVLTRPEENLQRNQIQIRRKDDVPTTDSTFSELARSVLVHQSEAAARRSIADGKTALKILQRHNSTPFKPQQNSPQLPVGVDFSPIQIQSEINDRSKIQNLSSRGATSALFQISARELPSYSGSNKTLTGKNRRNKTLVRPTTATSSMSLSSILHEQQKPSSRIGLTMSSFSSNDSNAENEPPAATPSSIQIQQQDILEMRTNNENDIIHSARQFPNPRRTLAHRSPLKTINIIDIVTLPPYTGPISKPNQKCENLTNDKTNDNNESELFGFEEYLDDDNNDDHETENESLSFENKSKTNSSRLNISKQLRKLKRLRPKSTTYSRNTVNSTITKNIFDDDDGGKPGTSKGNRNIREMLCSTMVNNELEKNQHPEYSSNTLAEDSDSEDSVSSKLLEIEKKEAELFGDPEPTFDQKSFHRTYERPIRRKRKLIHQFSDIYDSDEENTDEEVDALNTSDLKRKGCKTKKRQVNSPEKEELDKFVSDFNSMLKEAEDYELIVE